MSGRAQALAGLRVVDLSVGTAGGVATMLLGDYGAEVVRAEPAVAVRTDEPGVPVWHRNKLCVTLDWSEASELERLRVLLAGADACVTTEDSARRALGLDDDEATARAWPRLVHLKLAGLSLPDGAPTGGVELDTLIAAFTGMARRQSSFEGGPVDSVYASIQYLQGLWGAACAVAALIERESSGLGQRVTVDALHATILAGTPTMVVNPSVPLNATDVGPGGPNPMYSPYRCSDDRWLFLGALLPKFQDAAFRVLGIEGVLGDERVAGNRQAFYEPSVRRWLRGRMDEAFAACPRDEWLERLEAADCPAGPVQDRDAWLDHPQVVAMGLRKTVTDPELGTVVMAGAPVELVGTPPVEPAPRRLASSSELPTWEPIDVPSASPATRSAPLAGFRVVDLGTILAGPLAGVLLASLGASVVKVETPEGDSFRTTGFHYNRGQRSLALNLRHPQGKTWFRTLAAATDIVIDNYRPGVLERLEIDYDSLRSVRPDIISISISGFSVVGPLAGKPGFDPILQAMSGMQSAQGGESDPVFFTLAVNDVGGATLAAFAACMALFHRLRRGEGQAVRTSLVAASTFMQNGELVRYEGRPAARLGGRDYMGPSWWDRHYRTADGWIRIHAAGREELEATGLLENVELSDDDACLKAMTAALERRRDEEVLRLLARAGVTAVPARTLNDFFSDEVMRAEQYVVQLTNNDGNAVFVPGHYARFSAAEAPASLIPPGLGEHSRQLLGELGVSSEEIERALDERIVVSGPPMTTFPTVSYR